MTNQDRLKLAHNRRKQQLKAWAQQEKYWATGGQPILSSKSSHHTKGPSPPPPPPPPQSIGGSGEKGTKVKGSGVRIRFKNSIMLLEAAGRNDVDEVRRLLESGVDADVANEDGLTALHQCCIDDNEELLKLLLDFGANVNSEDSEKWTPLHAAATCGHLHLVKHLIAKGANLLSVNAEGNMPYDICDEEGTLDYIESEMAKGGVTQELIEEIRALPETTMLQDLQLIHAQDGDLNYRDPDGATYLHMACANGYVRVVEFLLDNHMSTDAQDKDCWQPIHAAACWGHIDVLELLVQNGADLNARTKNNETPYAICEDPEMKERIIQLRSELETKVGGVRRIRRSQSSNSRTQSIRRTSQREKGLSSKRDVADEAQMFLTITHIDIKDKDSSPSPDPSSSHLPTHPADPADPSESEPELQLTLPLHVPFVNSMTGQELGVEDTDDLTPTPTPSAQKTKYVSNHNNNLITPPPPPPPYEGHGQGQGQPKYNNPIANYANVHPVMNLNSMRVEKSAELPIPDIDVSSTGGGGGGVVKEGQGQGQGVGGDNRIDIHVQVTINTSPSSTGGGGGGGGGATYTPPGTLADLKKQRSLHYSNHTRSNSIQSNGRSEHPPKYSPPQSPTLSLKRFSGPPGDIVGDYSSSGKKCCSIM